MGKSAAVMPKILMPALKSSSLLKMIGWFSGVEMCQKSCGEVMFIIVFCTKKRLFISFKKFSNAYLQNRAYGTAGGGFGRARFPFFVLFSHFRAPF